MARELEEARRQELESARLRAWTEMARRVAHELKNPLTPMRMSASALARSDDTRVRETAEMLLEEVARLEEMARTFAQFGRLPEGPTAPVDLVELLEALAERHDGKPVPVRLHVSTPLPMVSGHHELLSRVFRNLVVNAQEAASEGGGTAVEVRVEARDGHVRVAVSDDGPGIPPELLERIWLPDVTTKRKGTGLGLPMVRQAVTAHGGRVEASNRRGGGAEFVVTLPVEAPTGPAAAAQTPADGRE
jgi:signal transduction histidine kinase